MKQQHQVGSHLHGCSFERGQATAAMATDDNTPYSRVLVPVGPPVEADVLCSVNVSMVTVCRSLVKMQVKKVTAERRQDVQAALSRRRAASTGRTSWLFPPPSRPVSPRRRSPSHHQRGPSGPADGGVLRRRCGAQVDHRTHSTVVTVVVWFRGLHSLGLLRHGLWF